jgi:hypothetical protein
MHSIGEVVKQLIEVMLFWAADPLDRAPLCISVLAATHRPNVTPGAPQGDNLSNDSDDLQWFMERWEWSSVCSRARLNGRWLQVPCGWSSNNLTLKESKSMVSLRKLAGAAAAAALGGWLFAAAVPAAAVEAHSGIQPDWPTGAYHTRHGYRRPHNGYSYDHPGWENPLAGVSGLAGGVTGAADGVVGGPAYGNAYPYLPKVCNDKATMYMCSKVDHDGSGNPKK